MSLVRERAMFELEHSMESERWYIEQVSILRKCTYCGSARIETNRSKLYSEQNGTI